jgi:nucleotide-binding universal stress UspA family protein
MALTHILVGVDFTPGSLGAAVRAAEIAAQHGARLTLVHAATVPERPQVPESMQETADAYVAVLANRLAGDRDRLATLRTELGAHGVEVSQVLVDRFADDALVEAATELHVDLIVTGTSEQSKLRRWLLGSTTESVVRSAPCSVLVSRTGDPERGFQRVMVGTDYSPAAELALERARDIAAPGAEIDVVHCLHLAFPAAQLDQLPLGQDPRTLHAQLSADALGRGHALVERLGRPGRVMRFTVRDDTARHGLPDLAEEKQCDLVVVGSHGHRGLRRAILGSTTEAVVRHAPCSVLVVR